MPDIAIVQEFFDRIWNRGDVTGARELFHPYAMTSGFGSDMAYDLEDFITFAQSIQMLVSTPRMDVLNVVTQGDWLSARIRCRALSRMSGAEIDITGQLMIRVLDRRIIEAYNHFDMVGFFVQLGLVPKDAMERVLSGAVAA